jgi:hypothetical protein
MKFVVIAAGVREDLVRTSETAWDALNQASALTAMGSGLVTISDEAGHEYAIKDFRRRFLSTTRHAGLVSSKTEREDVRRDMSAQIPVRTCAR